MFGTSELTHTHFAAKGESQTSKTAGAHLFRKLARECFGIRTRGPQRPAYRGLG